MASLLLLQMRCKVPQLVKAQAACADRAGGQWGVEGPSFYIVDSVSSEASKEAEAATTAISQRQGSVHVCVCVME